MSDRIIHYKEKVEPYKHLPQTEIDQHLRTVFPLISYFYFNSKKAVESVYNRFGKDKAVNLMMDSGVFSYRKKGGDVDIDKYINFLNDSADYINYAITLDYPHEAEAIIKNSDYIKARLDPRVTLVPVIQSFLFNEEQIEYTLANYEFICIGTYDGKHKSIMYNKEVSKTLKPIYEINKKYNRILHGLGRTKASWLYKNKMDSSDSSSWARCLFSGKTPVWDKNKLDYVIFTAQEKFRLHNYEDMFEKRFNISKKEFYTCIDEHIHLYCDTYPHHAICALTFLIMQEAIRLKKPNYRMFLASSNAVNFDALDIASTLYYDRNKKYDYMAV